MLTREERLALAARIRLGEIIPGDNPDSYSCLGRNRYVDQFLEWHREERNTHDTFTIHRILSAKPNICGCLAPAGG